MAKVAVKFMTERLSDVYLEVLWTAFTCLYIYISSPGFLSCWSWRIFPTMFIFNLLSSLPVFFFWLTGTLGVDFSSELFPCQITMCNIIKATPFWILFLFGWGFFHYRNTRLVGSKTTLQTTLALPFLPVKLHHPFEQMFTNLIG